jgi:hypothetical protein
MRSEGGCCPEGSYLFVPGCQMVLKTDSTFSQRPHGGKDLAFSASLRPWGLHKSLLSALWLKASKVSTSKAIGRTHLSERLSAYKIDY